MLGNKMSDTLEKEIQQLRNDLRVDLEDYKLLHTRQKLYDFTTDKIEEGELFIGWYSGEDYCENDGKPFSDLAIVYKNYLSCCIHDKLTKLKELLGEQILNKILKEVENGRR